MVKKTDDFMQRLCHSIKKLKSRIVTRRNGTIRFWLGATEYCPITFVCRVENDTWHSTGNFILAATELHISCEMARYLASAADGRSKKQLIKKLRAQMLATIRKCRPD